MSHVLAVGGQGIWVQCYQGLLGLLHGLLLLLCRFFQFLLRFFAVEKLLFQGGLQILQTFTFAIIVLIFSLITNHLVQLGGNGLVLGVHGFMFRFALYLFAFFLTILLLFLECFSKECFRVCQLCELLAGIRLLFRQNPLHPLFLLAQGVIIGPCRCREVEVGHPLFVGFELGGFHLFATDC